MTGSDTYFPFRYLHTLFTRMPEQYNTLEEFSDYHTQQTALYARYAPTFKRPERAEYIKDSGRRSSVNSWDQVSGRKESDPNGLHSPSSTSSSASLLKVPDSDFLLFLKTSAFVSLELALKECEKRKPPLYLEMIFILGKLGESRSQSRSQSCI